MFPYNLAIVAIFKNEGHYLEEWIEYHLLAGVEHFYLYNNDSTDNYAEVLEQYIEANIVTLIDFPGDVIQLPAYNDALMKFRFHCRYIAFVDIDEFIFPRTGQSIVEVVDEVLSKDESAAALAINWQVFGSNGQEKADYSKGVLERFTRRAPRDWKPDLDSREEVSNGNTHVKSIVNPRKVSCCVNPHYATYYQGYHAVNENGGIVKFFKNDPVTSDKIVVNHYYLKSFEERCIKKKRGRAAINVKYKDENFDIFDRNEEFDDSILKYRNEREKVFVVENDTHRFKRVEKNLFDTLTQYSPANVPKEFFYKRFDIFLTCRALGELLKTKIGKHTSEEFALVWINQILQQTEVMYLADYQLMVEVLPDILARPYPICGKILKQVREQVIYILCTVSKRRFNPQAYTKFKYIERLLNLFEV